jgi:hypothetical protein
VVPSALPVIRFSHLLQVTLGRELIKRTGGAWFVFAISVALALPCLAFRYLPMVDLPQHEAIVSILRHLHDRNFGFDSYYRWAPVGTLYIAPYLAGFALSHFISVATAMHIVVFCSVLSYPIGIMLCLRALKRSAYLGLLAMPFVYNQSFFWGFVNFKLALGLSIIALSLLIGEWSARKAVTFALLSLVIAVTHVYGLVLLASYMVIWLLLGERKAAAKRLVALIPAAAALVLWLVLLSNARGYEGLDWGGLASRWSRFPEAIVGGWRGNSEKIFLGCILLAIVAFSRRSMPINALRWRGLNLHVRVVWIFVGLHLVVYFCMPELAVAANKASFRHAEMAVLALPLTVTSEDAAATPVWLRLGVAALAIALVVSSWSHFRRFNHEAESFDAIINAIPTRQRVAQLTYERSGRVARVPAYLHFAAYVQSMKGGLLAVSFPTRFWNIPVKRVKDPASHNVPRGLEWNPRLFETSGLDKNFEYVIVRVARHHGPRLPQPFPYQLQLTSGPWWLFHRYESIHE